MDRQFLSGITSIVLIVLIVGWSVGDRAPQRDFKTQTLGGNAFQVAIANGAPLIDVEQPLDITLLVNGGTLPEHTTLALRNNVIRYTVDEKASPVTGINIELIGSEEAIVAEFTVQHGLTSDGGADGIAPLVASRNQDGLWHTYVSGEQLTVLRNKFGPGWYTFTATASRGTESSGVLRVSYFIA